MGTPMKKRWADLDARIEAALLPGAAKRASEDEVLSKKLAGLQRLMASAVEKDDEVAFERSSTTWAECWRQANETIAEEYRQRVPPEEWELRYIKWMKIRFLRMTCPAGEFYLVPRRPNRRPRAEFWYTVDEMIDMVSSPAVQSAIAVFGVLPSRPEEVKLGPGEKHFHVDFTELEPRAWFDVNISPKWTLHGNKLPLGEVLAVDDD